MNRKPKQLQVPLWPDPKDYHGLPPINRDPLVQALWNKTEAEFLAMFEVPSQPDK